VLIRVHERWVDELAQQLQRTRVSLAMKKSPLTHATTKSRREVSPTSGATSRSAKTARLSRTPARFPPSGEDVAF
jgi:hypothetical protein